MTLRKYLIGLPGGTCLFLLLVLPPAARAAEAPLYEAALPAQLFSAPELCRYAPCREVVPQADSFSARKGLPPYVEAYRSEANGRQLIGYAFLSTDVVDIPGYSGKPIVTLIGMDTRGVITGARILSHSESALRVGVPEARLSEFVGQYVGKSIGDQWVIGAPRHEPKVIGLDAISGATVTTVAENQVMISSGLAIARQVGIIKPLDRAPARYADTNETLGWDAMLKEGSIQHLRISEADVGGTGDGDYLDIYFGDLDAPVIGRSVLGEQGYATLKSRLQPGDQAIFLVASGAASFKGSGFARGGIYERIRVLQGIDSFLFRDLDYLNLPAVAAANAPAYRESGVFIIRSDRFSGAYPWRLVILASWSDKASGLRRFTSFDQEYRLPARYLKGENPAAEHPGQPRSATEIVRDNFGIFALVILLGVIFLVMQLRSKPKPRVTHLHKRSRRF